jgi:hypothetical protein
MVVVVVVVLCVTDTIATLLFGITHRQRDQINLEGGGCS